MIGRSKKRLVDILSLQIRNFGQNWIFILEYLKYQGRGCTYQKLANSKHCMLNKSKNKLSHFFTPCISIDYIFVYIAYIFYCSILHTITWVFIFTLESPLWRKWHLLKFENVFMSGGYPDDDLETKLCNVISLSWLHQ